MKKNGNWIATFGPSLRVSKVNVEASVALDLVEVTTVGEGGQLTNIFYFDRMEAAELMLALREALDGLEKAAIEDEPAADRYAARFTRNRAGGEVWFVVDQSLDDAVLAHVGTFSTEADAQLAADRLNKAFRPGSDHKRASVPGA